MASEHNRIRKKWQDYGGSKAALAELSFFEVFTQMFVGTNYQIKARPQEFKNIYLNIKLPEQDLSQIYIPEKQIAKHGIIPDCVIENKNSGKKIYIEVKRQDGWIEGGIRKDGRGNVHERSCKFFTPGLLNILQNASKIEPPNLPFWTIFQGNITRDPCRVREITCWYDKYTNHFFFWRYAPNPDMLFKHFDECIAPLLE